MVIDVETGKAIHSLRFDVQVKVAKGVEVKPAQWELLLKCGDALLEIVREASPHQVGDRKAVLKVDADGAVNIQIKPIQGNHDFDERGMELEQMAVSAFLTGMGAMWTATPHHNPVKVGDDKKGISATVDSAEVLAKLINARGRATGSGAPIAPSLIIAAEQESSAAKGRSR